MVLYDRDEKGELIAQYRPLVIEEDNDLQKEFDGYEVAIIPMTRGETKRIFSDVLKKDDKDLDGELVIKYCKDPAFTEEEVKHAKPALVGAIVNTILKESGIDVGSKTRKQAVKDAEDEFAKN